MSEAATETTYEVLVEETNYVAYYVRAGSEDEARELVSQGEHDDYETMSSETVCIVEVTPV